MDIKDDHTFACASDDGVISVTKTVLNNVACFQTEVYAYRDNLTDIVISNLITDKKLKIKCKEAINLISIYKER